MGEDFISGNTPLTINNDPLVVPLCNETDLFISQSVKEQVHKSCLVVTSKF
jgi:hypothetical protein